MFVDQNLDQIYVHENLDSGKLSKKKRRNGEGRGKRKTQWRTESRNDGRKEKRIKEKNEK